MTLSNLIALITLLLAVGGASIAIYNYIRKNPEPRQLVMRIGIAFLAVCLVLAVVVVFQSATRNSVAGRTPIGDIFSNSTPTLSATNTPVLTPTPIPTATLVPTATPVPQPGTILYQADWSHGLDGWGASADWKYYNSMLVDDGTYAPCSSSSFPEPPTLVPPYQPNTADYSIEVQMQIVHGSNGICSNNTFGIVARGSSDGNGNWSGYAAYIFQDGGTYISDFSNSLASATLNPGTSWHTYRFEVHGTSLKLFVDGGLAIATSDAKYLTSPGQLGLWDDSLYLNLRSYVVKQL